MLAPQESPPMFFSGGASLHTSSCRQWLKHQRAPECCGICEDIVDGSADLIGIDSDDVIYYAFTDAESFPCQLA